MTRITQRRPLVVTDAGSKKPSLFAAVIKLIGQAIALGILVAILLGVVIGLRALVGVL